MIATWVIFMSSSEVDKILEGTKLENKNGFLYVYSKYIKGYKYIYRHTLKTKIIKST